MGRFSNVNHPLRYLAWPVVALALVLFALPEASADDLALRAKRQARSVHLFYQPAVSNAAAAVGTVTVTESQTNSYYCVLGWDCGYCGIQDLGPWGNILIFSVWDPGNQHDYHARPDRVKEELRAKVLFARKGVDVARFGGEGTGARTITPIGWKVGEPVTVRVEAAPDGTNRTAYTCFYKNPADGEWQRIAAVSTLKHAGRARGLNGVYSFVEDFWRNGFSARRSRRAEFSGVATRGGDSETWVPATRARFTADSTPSAAIDAGRAPNGAFFLQTGGATTNAHARLYSWIE